MDAVLCIIAGPLFLISIAAHLYVKLRLRPKENSGLEDYYHEFEDQQPDFVRYEQWSRITFIAAAGALLLFIARVI